MIYNDLQIGDIILSRNVLDPTRRLLDNNIVSFWRSAYLYIGNGLIIKIVNNTYAIQFLNNYTTDKVSIGIFRIEHGLTLEEKKKILRGVMFSIGICFLLYNIYWKIKSIFVKQLIDPSIGFWSYTSLSNNDFIVKLYSLIDKKFDTNATSSIFDHSRLTVRIR